MMPAKPDVPKGATLGRTVPVDQLVYAVGEVETGGINPLARRYTTVNSIGAHGRYQVMRANIAGWTREALGKVMTPGQFLASPSAQDRVAAYKLGAYQKKYGSWESAAAVWFSGQPNPDSKASDGGNTVRQYVDKVKAALGGGSVAGGGGGKDVSPPGGTSTLIDIIKSLMEPFTQMGRAMLSVGQFAELLLKLALPSTWVRIVCGVFGIAFLLFGLIVLGREAKGS